ncbi:Uu.00g119220.m01.CDS01 [Anthostomella pinea]|uniref:Uu.00g119220.m01.CDS01 n=1 Tax=Anthostomella pinea TaxID=933095 RepID=A0AAI8YEP4_9PEZI|nr:Uu.00g119220.m01.CDS01 [Anthostomella pinea]
MGLLSLKYRRPQHVDREDFRRRTSDLSLDEKRDASLSSGPSGASSGIPDALTFEKIMNGGTCPPCTIRDFMNYLVYIEHSAENLQFFLWYRDYVKRFNDATTSDIALAPEWTKAMEEDAITKIQKDAAGKIKKDNTPAAAIFKGTCFEKPAESVIENKDPFWTPPATADSGDALSILSGTRTISTYQTHTRDAFSAAGAKQPFTIQPFRAEINRVIATYIVDDAPRQLNLSAREMKAVVQALSYTTHPSAFRSLARNIENTLRKQAHPNFIRWTICNGNPARVTFACGLGVGTILVSTLGAILLALSGAKRGWRALLAIGWVIGIATLITACKGMCVVLHGMHHRHVRPWELFDDNSDHASQEELRESKRSFESFGSGNSYEDEPWVVKYDRRNVVCKVFDRQVWIQEPALRQIQDTIFVQSMLSALLGAAILTAVFVAVPAGDYY